MSTRRSTYASDLRITLGLLNAAAEGKPLSQRRLATEMGIALGLVNAYVKRCVKKGLLKVSEAPARRYVYYLTAEGFSEKARLTSEYLTSSLEFFRRTRCDCADIVTEAQLRGWEKVALVGASDIAEIAQLCIADSSLRVVAVVDKRLHVERFCGLPVVASLDELDTPPDGVFITAIAHAESLSRELTEILGADKVLVPKLVAAGFSRNASRAGH